MNKMKEKVEDGIMSWKQFMELSNVHSNNCISIYFPTHRAGEPVDSGEGQLRLKNSLQSVNKILEERGINSREIQNIVGPVEELLDEIHFWRNQSDGLAIFSDGETMQYFTLPVHFDEQIYISDHYLLLPIIPYFNDDGIFYLLPLSLQMVNLYECSRHSITEIITKGETPERLEDIVGYDFEQTSLQHRSGQGGKEDVMYHGQGAGKDDKKKETEKFFRAVDAAVLKLLGDDKAPLVLACVDEHYSLYKKITSYSNLTDGHVSGNPDESEVLTLHEEAWSLVEDQFRKQRESRKKQFQDQSATGKAVTDIRKIIPAAVDGRIDTLFMEEGKDLFGIYDETKRKIELAEPGNRLYQVSLFNLAALHVLSKGGRVFLSSAEEMPIKETEMNALLRY